MPENVKIGLYQGYHGEGVPIDIAEIIADEKPDILCLPEYFFVRPDEKSILLSAERHDFHLQYLADLSNRFQCAITGGTLLVRENGLMKNRCYFIEDSTVVDHYDKIHLYKNEGRGRLTPGHEYKVIDYRRFRIGLLICADVLYEESFYNIRGLNPDLIIVPVTSPHIEGESIEDKLARDERIWTEAVKITGCPILKVGSVGKIAGRRLQGRSLLATSGGISFRVAPEDEDKPMLKFINLTV